METLVNAGVPAVNFFLLAAVGMDLTGDDFRRVRQQRAIVLAGLLAPVFLLPPIAVGLIALFEASPNVASGLLLVAACPIGGISNVYNYLAKASTALSVTLTGLSCLCASLTIPLIRQGLELSIGRPLEFAAPLPVLVVQLLLMLALPVALGMWIRRRSPGVAARYRPGMQRLAFIGITMIFVLIIAADPAGFASELPATVPLAAMFVVVSMVAGWITAAVITPDHRERFTLAAEFGTRNLGVAVAIAVTILGRVEFARFATTYALTEIPLMFVAIALFRRHQVRIEARRTRASVLNV